MNRWKLLLIASLTAGLCTAGCEGEQQEAEEAQAPQESEELQNLEEAEAPEAAAEAPAHPVVGELAPDFTLPDETGKEHTLSDYRGQTVVLEWFNIECPYVVRHYGEGTFDKILQEFGGTDEIVWLAIDTTYNHTSETTLEFKAEANEEREYDYPVLQDPAGDIGRLYEAKTTPHMFVIDAEGILQYMGGIDDDPRGRVDAEERTNYVADALAAMRDGEAIATTEAQPYGCTIKFDEDS